MKIVYDTTIRGVITGIMVLALLVSPALPAVATTHDGVGESSTSAVSEEVQGIRPSLIIVPRLDVAATVEPVGKTAEGAMDVPTDWRDVAWYQPGFAPGENGHAAFAAHRDWKGNAGPFWDLTSMKIGDLIAVADTNNRVMIYITTSNTSYGKDAQVSRQVFGLSTKPEMSLITCEGNYLDAEDTYDKRQVVEAELLYDSAAGNIGA